MNRIKKYFAFAMSIVMIFVLTVPAVSAEEDITVIINNKKLNFASVKPFKDEESGRIMVPVRALLEELGAKVSYDSETKLISITSDISDISFIADDDIATVNGVEVLLDCPASVINSSTYVPLRFVSENMNLRVGFDSETNTVTLTNRGNFNLGSTNNEIKTIFGSPDRVDMSEKGYYWNVYSSDMTEYKQIGIYDNKVVAYYLHMQSFVHSTGIRSGILRADCDAIMKSAGYSSDLKASYSVYTGKDNIITAFFDGEAKCYAMLVESLEYSKLNRITSAVLEGFEKTMIDLVNVERVKSGLELLKADSAISKVAKSHSTDMANNNYYSHKNSEGKTSYDRIKAAGIADFYSTEAISKAFPNSFTAFSSHLGNLGYISAMLARYTHIGTGCAFNANSDGILYYTQILYASK